MCFHYIRLNINLQPPLFSKTFLRVSVVFPFFPTQISVCMLYALNIPRCFCDSIVGTLTVVGQGNLGFECWQQRQEIFLLSKISTTAPGPTPPPISLEVKNEWSCTTTRLKCLHGVERDNFTFRVYCHLQA